MVTTWAATRPDAGWLPRARLDDLIDALRRDGRTVVGPHLADGAIAMVEIDRAADLPIGWTATSSPGEARLVRRPADDPGSARAFDHATAWSGIKPWTFPSKVATLTFEPGASDELTTRAGPGLATGAPAPAALAAAPRPLAVIGARACDLAALRIHDRVLAGGPAVDPDYAARRADLLVVAVECALATATCFCSSMGTGPEVGDGADIVLAELDDGFVARAGSAAGLAVLTGLGLGAAPSSARASADRQVAATRATMAAGLGVDTEGLRDRLVDSLDSPGWDAIAERCLACTNCTLVCPTCFCTGVTVTSDLDSRASTAIRTWDSCFTAGFAQVAGGSFRPRQRDRYRQWLTHKFGTWQDQFGSSGCVGCGRCIAWCPVGIDVRESLLHVAPRAAATPASTAMPVAVPIRPASPTIRTEYVTARVAAVAQETADTSTLRIATDDPALIAARPGQFVMAAVPAFAIPPLSISRIRPDGLELTIRAAGPSTSFLTRLRPGAELALRGPLGRPWPIDDARGRDVVIVAGGIGLAPLRCLIDQVLAERDQFGAVRLYIGARTPQDRLYVEELDALAARDDVLVRMTVDRAGPEWLGRVGIVTQLFRSVTGTGKNVTAFICGPERMMTAVTDVMADLGVAPGHTWLTLERRMECGVGLCGHCQMGSRFVCKDGPVFSVAELGSDLRREGL
jgi:NAD(P)H-flavin reductase/Pyruvate/2-oxoacid:ferredoxin oxidoreductase delta subunit